MTISARIPETPIAHATAMYRQESVGAKAKDHLIHKVVGPGEFVGVGVDAKPVMPAKQLEDYLNDNLSTNELRWFARWRNNCYGPLEGAARIRVGRTAGREQDEYLLIRSQYTGNGFPSAALLKIRGKNVTDPDTKAPTRIIPLSRYVYRDGTPVCMAFINRSAGSTGTDGSELHVMLHRNGHLAIASPQDYSLSDDMHRTSYPRTSNPPILVTYGPEAAIGQAERWVRDGKAFVGIALDLARTVLQGFSREG